MKLTISEISAAIHNSETRFPETFRRLKGEFGRVKELHLRIEKLSQDQRAAVADLQLLTATGDLAKIQGGLERVQRAAAQKAAAEEQFSALVDNAERLFAPAADAFNAAAAMEPLLKVLKAQWLDVDEGLRREILAATAQTIAW